jgi:hypothetical protein
MQISINPFSKVILVLLLPINLIFAQATLSPESAKAFLDFYYNGAGQGIVLADSRICAKVENNQYEGEISAEAIKKDVSNYLWMTFVVPQETAEAKVIIQFNHEGITRLTREATVKGSIRYRTWKSFRLNQAGEWEIKILFDHGDGMQTLKTQLLTVVE